MTEPRQYGPAVAREPATDEVGTESAAAENAGEPAAEEVEMEPLTDEAATEPATDEVARGPATDEVATEPAAEEIAGEPAAEEVEMEPLTDEAARDPATDEVATEPATEETAPASTEDGRIELGEPVVSAYQPAAAASRPAQTASASLDDEQAGPRWSEIQALFVDDPRGSVERALEATHGGLMTVISVLRLQEGSIPADPSEPPAEAAGDTERLRVALRSCRTFWQDLADLSDLLRRPE
jgi:hypothetical protein